MKMNLSNFTSPLLTSSAKKVDESKVYSLSRCFISPNGALLLQGSEVKPITKIRNDSENDSILLEQQQIQQQDGQDIVIDNNNFDGYSDNDNTIENIIDEPPNDNVLLSPNKPLIKPKKTRGYELLDPYTDESYQNKPIKIARTYTEYSHLINGYNLPLEHPIPIEETITQFYNKEFKPIYNIKQKEIKKERMLKLRQKYSEYV